MELTDDEAGKLCPVDRRQPYQRQASAAAAGGRLHAMLAARVKVICPWYWQVLGDVALALRHGRYVHAVSCGGARTTPQGRD